MTWRGLDFGPGLTEAASNMAQGYKDMQDLRAYQNQLARQQAMDALQSQQVNFNTPQKVYVSEDDLNSYTPDPLPAIKGAFQQGAQDLGGAKKEKQTPTYSGRTGKQLSVTPAPVGKPVADNGDNGRYLQSEGDAIPVQPDQAQDPVQALYQQGILKGDAHDPYRLKAFQNGLQIEETPMGPRAYGTNKYAENFQNRGDKMISAITQAYAAGARPIVPYSIDRGNGNGRAVDPNAAKLKALNAAVANAKNDVNLQSALKKTGGKMASYGMAPDLTPAEAQAVQTFNALTNQVSQAQAQMAGIGAPAAAPAETKMINGVLYQKVPGGWKKAK